MRVRPGMRASTTVLAAFAVVTAVVWTLLLQTRNYQSGTALAAVTTAPLSAPAEPAGSSAQSSVAVLGDAFSTGLAPASLAPGWRLMNLSQPGAGYLASGASAGATLGDQVTAAVAAHPTVVIVAGGHDDVALVTAGSATRADFAAAVGTQLDSLRRGMPSALIAVVGVYWPGGAVPVVATQLNDVLQTAAGARNMTFIDPIDELWITGQADRPGVGNAAHYMSADGSGPTPAGFDYLAARLQADLGACCDPG